MRRPKNIYKEEIQQRQKQNMARVRKMFHYICNDKRRHSKRHKPTRHDRQMVANEEDYRKMLKNMATAVAG